MAGLDDGWRSALTALVAVAVPVAGGIAAGMNGDGDGPIFQAGAVLGAGITTLMATRRGLWWLVPAQPMVVVPSAVLGVLLAEPRGTNHTKMGTDTVTALHHAFVLTLVALAGVLVVSVVKAALGRGGERRSTAAAESAVAEGAPEAGAQHG